MKYADLIQFEPINEVVKFDRLSDGEYRKSLVRNFVFSDAYEKSIIPAICRNLDYTTSAETFGIQIVGSYGTGKSHLMSLFSLVAEDAAYLDLVGSESAKKDLTMIAGKYKTIRFELGNDQELWDIVCYRIDEGLKALGIDYSIAADTSLRSYAEKINVMMAFFEQKYPNHGLMIIIDEMLSYLKGRSGSDALNRDLAVLQGLGQASDKSKFRMVFGVQELIYNAPEFQFAAQMLQKVNDRFKDLTITKQDVEFVTSRRLLKKNDAQKAKIREHLSKFTAYFTEVSKDLDKYVELFPVNPSYFDNFSRIRVAKSQREVLKTLSAKFAAIMSQDVPTQEPGLISYDSYWDDMDASSDMKTDPDVRRVSEIMEIIYQKIDDNFRDARAKKAPLARRIAGACAIKILQDDLTRQNGITAESLVDDLCYLDANILDRDFLKDVIETTASQIVTATVGQYFEKNDQNQEFHLRVQGGVNYEQKIKDYAAQMTDDVKDSYWYSFLVEFLPVEVEQYRKEFKIFTHKIEWRSHKMMLDGYLFFGNPDQRSTTHPEQNFYIYFMPVFNKKNIVQKDEADSIYIRLETISDEMKDVISLYAASEALKASAPSSEKPYYDQFRKTWLDRLRGLFDKEFPQALRVFYQGKQQTLTPAQLAGPSKESIISNIASMLLEDHFCATLKDYPKFSLLLQPLSTSNQDAILKAARQKIANPNMSNRNGEAILAGLGLLDENTLSLQNSIYARSILQMMKDKGEDKVLNRDEILERFWEDIYRSKDFHIDSSFEYIVLCAMVVLGEIEIEYPGGKNINATSIKDTVDITKDFTYTFSHVRRPRGLNMPAVKELFLGITGHDYSNNLDDPEVYSKLLTAASAMASEIVSLQYKIKGGVSIGDVDIIDPFTATGLANSLDAMKGVCDQVPAYNTKAKMRNLRWSAADLKRFFESKPNIDKIRRALEIRDELKHRIDYLKQALQYVYVKEFEKEINDAIAKIDSVVEKGTDAALKAYEAELDKLIDKYIDWYLKEYERVTINEFQNNTKRMILSSDAKKVCDAACGEDFIPVSSQFIAWEKKMSQLTLKSSMVTKASLKNQPYQGFNPRDYKDFILPDINKLKDELDGIYTAIDHTLHVTLQDQNLLQNAKDALSDYEQKLVDKFHNVETNPDNVKQIIDIIHKLHAGIRKITITHEDILAVIDGLMTPKDVIKAFKELIETRTAGAEGDNIRILIK